MPRLSSAQAARCGIETALRGGPGLGGRRAARRRGRRRARADRARLPAAGLRQRGGALAALSAEELAAQHGVYVGAPRVKVKPEKTAKAEAGGPPARAPEEQEALHRVRWSWQPAGAPRPEVRRARVRIGHRLAHVARSCALLGGPVPQAVLQCARVCIVPHLTEARWRATCKHVRACASHLRGGTHVRRCLVAPCQLGKPVQQTVQPARLSCIMAAVRMSKAAVLARAGAEAGSADAASRVSCMRTTFNWPPSCAIAACSDAPGPYAAGRRCAERARMAGARRQRRHRPLPAAHMRPHESAWRRAV